MSQPATSVSLTSSASTSEKATEQSTTISRENLSQCLDAIKHNKDLLDRELKDQVMHEKTITGRIENVSKQAQRSITTLQRYLENFSLQDTQTTIKKEYERMKQLIEKEITFITSAGGDALDKRHALTLLNIIQRSYATLYANIDDKAAQKESATQPMWENQRLFLQQQQILQDQKVAGDFEDALKKIEVYAQDNGTTPGNCYFSYVRPDAEGKQANNEEWVQDFLVQLRADLRNAGIAMNIDFKDNKEGNAHKYMAKFKEGSFIIPVGTPSLLRKHNIGVGAICTELVIMNQKRAQNSRSVLPILLVGNIASSFPIYFGDYYVITTNWQEKSYQANLKILLQSLYNIGEDDKEYLAIWKEFENAHKEFAEPLSQEKAEELLAEKNQKQKLQQSADDKAVLQLCGEAKSASCSAASLLSSSYATLLTAATNSTVTDTTATVSADKNHHM